MLAQGINHKSEDDKLLFSQHKPLAIFQFDIWYKILGSHGRFHIYEMLIRLKSYTNTETHIASKNGQWFLP